MIGKGIPMSQSNKPRPMKSSCVASLRLVTNCQINSPAGEKFRGHSRPRPRGWLHRVSAGCNAAERRYIALASRVRRGGRVAEGARLESVYTGNRIVGSNPTPSASLLLHAVVKRRGKASNQMPAQATLAQVFQVPVALSPPCRNIRTISAAGRARLNR